MDLKALAALSRARGLSGRERAVRMLVQSLLPPGVRARTDAVGNLLVERPGDGGGPRVALLAHLDEVGLQVAGHTDDGLLRVHPVGGLDPRVLPGRAVRVGEAALPGAIGLVPHHLTRAADRAVLDFDDLFVDIGAGDRDTAKRLAAVGDSVTFDSAFASTPDGRLMGKALDDRAGVLLALWALAQPCAGSLCVAFTVQEEVGLRGAQVAVRALSPDVALALEATTALDTPGTAAGEEVTRLGAGPALTVVDGRSLPYAPLQESLREAASSAGVQWQWRRGHRGGNDAGAAWTQGVPAGTLSLPCRYLHAPVSVLAQQDLESTARLLGAWLAHVREVF